MEPRNRIIPPEKDARFILVGIEQIQVPPNTFKWLDCGNFYPMAVPSVKDPALSLLQLLQPILLAPSGKKMTGRNEGDVPPYILVGGRRTLQVILEQQSRKAKVRAILLGNEQIDTKSMEVMDSFCSILLHRPDHETLSMLAVALLDDREFSGIASKFLDVSTAQKIASTLGISRATLHRITTQLRENVSTLAKAPSTKTTLGIAEDTDAE
jgi:predicted DNA-binding protein (UPF0251 family)